MATKLEKETILREKAQLQARLDRLFAQQEKQTVGKKGKGGDKMFLGGLAAAGNIGSQMLSSAGSAGWFGVPSMINSIAGGIGISDPGSGALQMTPTTSAYQSGRPNSFQLFPNKGKGLLQGMSNTLPFLGPLYDVGRGLSPATQFNPQEFYNPEYGRASGQINRGLSLLANRRYDPTSELANVDQADAVYRQQLRSLPTGLGELQNRLAGASVRRRRGRGEVLSRAQNANLGLRGEEAQGRLGAADQLARLGSEKAQTKFSIADYNERAKAQRRNLLGAGLSGVGLGAQNLAMMQNQRLRDEQLLGILPSYGDGLYGLGPSGVRFGGQPMSAAERLRYIRGYGNTN